MYTEYTQEARKNPKSKITPMVSVSLDEPFKLYTDYFDFDMEKFDPSSISLRVMAKSTGKTWNISAAFGFNNLFLINWLASVKDTLKLTEEPKVHTVLLFMKHRFERVGNVLYRILK